MDFKYGLDEKPSFWAMLMFGIQWFAVAVPIIIIIGKITAGFHFNTPADQIVYLQKMTFIMAVALILQIIWGHRLPLITGPSTVLLIGVIASQGFQVNTVYSAILSGGALMALLSFTGLFSYLRVLFTPRIVSVVLLLIAFTLAPTLQNLIIADSPGQMPLVHLVFAIAFVLCMFLLHRYLKGIWKSTLILWAMLAGSLLYVIIFQQRHGLMSNASGHIVSSFFSHVTTGLSFDAGVFISFLFCFMALAVNDLGSIQSMYEILKPDDMKGRIRRGMVITGLANVASGFLGVIGPVNFSLSPGIIASTGCGSRFPLMITSFLLLVLSFSPLVINFIGNVPPVIIGSVMIYILCSQIAAGLMVVIGSQEGFRFDTGLILGLPILLATIIAFMPAATLNTFPDFLKPIVGNGFVVGVIAALLMEHIIIKK